LGGRALGGQLGGAGRWTASWGGRALGGQLGGRAGRPDGGWVQP